MTGWCALLKPNNTVIRILHMKIKRTKKYFVGIDSDGTAFDSMMVKHREAFIPAMIEVWKLEAVADEVYKTAEYINLYSEHRGIDRFKGLVETFDSLRKSCGAAFCMEDYEPLRRFTDSESAMSNAGLKEYMKNVNAPILENTLRWSVSADEAFRDKMKNLPPFRQCAEAIREMSTVADIAVITSASYESIVGDWNRCDIGAYTAFMGGQEFGSKSNQLKMALDAGFESHECLMIGDTMGDLRAAEANGMKFYLIIPGKEEISWEKLQSKYFEMFVSDKYKTSAQEIEHLYNAEVQRRI